MRFSKWILLFVFIAGAFLGKPIALGFAGVITKTYLFLEFGWQFSYRTVDWRDGYLIFSDIHLKEKEALDLEASQATLSFRTNHVEVDHPKVLLTALPKHRSDRWTISMKEGIFRGGKGLEGVHFSFEKLWPHHLGRFSLAKETSSTQIEIVEEGKEICLDVELHQFDAKMLEPWGNFQGIIDGKIHLVFEEKGKTRGSAHLDVQNGGYATFFLGIDGSLDWEGSLRDDWFPKYDEGRMRLLLTGGSLQGLGGNVEELKGNYSFTQGIGAKWEFEGQATLKDKNAPLSWKGRAFLYPLRPYWMESEGLCGKSFFSVTGRKEGDFFLFEFGSEHINSFSFMWAESFFPFFHPKWEEIEFERGELALQGKGKFFKNAMKEWEISLIADNVSWRRGHFAVQCELASGFFSSQNGINGDFSISGLALQEKWLDKTLFFADHLKGIGSVRGGRLEKTLFEGNILDLNLCLSLQGTLDDFSLQAHGNNCDVQIFAKKEEERLHFNIGEGIFEGFSFQGTGWMDWDGEFFCHLDHFGGPFSPLYRKLGGKEDLSGEIFSIGEGLQVSGNRSSWDLFVQAKGEVSPNLPFHVAFLEKRGEKWNFDFRLENPFWDVARLYGSFDQGVFSFDSTLTHFLGKPLQITECVWEKGGMETLHLQTVLSWETLVASLPFWVEGVTQWISLPISGDALMRVSFENTKGSSIAIEGQNLLWRGNPLLFQARIEEEKGIWRISSIQFNQYRMSAVLQKELSALRIKEGHIEGEGIDIAYEGLIDRSFQYDFFFPHIELDLKDIETFFPKFALKDLKGTLEGKGRLSSKEKMEASLDLTASNLECLSLHWKQEGLFKVSYASDSGFTCEGISASGFKEEELILSCEIGRLEFEKPHLLWILKNAKIDLPAHFLKRFSLRPEITHFFDQEEELRFTLDHLQCPLDFSSFSCCIGALSLPFHEEVREIRNLSLLFDDKEMNAHFQLFYQEKPIWISSHLFFDAPLCGRMTLEENERALSILWTYSDTRILIHEIEGQFGGIEASFHALEKDASLIGSARLNFRELSDWAPPKLKTLFQTLKMGDGYEIKGKLSLDKGFSFQGLLSGKQVGLFGFHFRTLLSQIELNPEQVHLYDLKISDSAGVMKIDELLAKKEDVWTLSIPHLVVLELRPSLLQKEEEPSPPSIAGPLVVRELRMDNFKGILDQSETYTAKGKIQFINSYRREHTVFDLPSDVLGRIVGLDLDLLIPTCGLIQYELKEGAFYLTSLQDSYSEGKRSQFSLAEDPPPMMDLEGNLYITVTMKQFVLFKLTESFQILVDGKLNDPKYHLQKKKRFLGF